VERTHPGHPPGWCLGEYGFLGVDWPGLGRYVLEPGKPVVLAYRVFVHRGDAQAAKVAEAYEAFAHPPRSRVVVVE